MNTQSLTLKERIFSPIGLQEKRLNEIGFSGTIPFSTVKKVRESLFALRENNQVHFFPVVLPKKISTWSAGDMLRTADEALGKQEIDLIGTRNYPEINTAERNEAWYGAFEDSSRQQEGEFSVAFMGFGHDCPIQAITNVREENSTQARKTMSTPLEILLMALSVQPARRFWSVYPDWLIVSGTSTQKNGPLCLEFRSYQVAIESMRHALFVNPAKIHSGGFSSTIFI